MREITRKVLRYQSSRSNLDGSRDSDTPLRSESPQDTPDTPSTPQPRTRDFFFSNNNNDDAGSPWTILSPFTCSQRNAPHRNRHLRRLSSTPSGKDFDNEVWEMDKGSVLTTPSEPDSLTSPAVGSGSLPDCPSLRAVSQAPILRSVSMDETMRSPASGFRLGDFLLKSMSQRSYSSGSRTECMRDGGARVSSLLGKKAGNHVEDQGSSSGLLSFLRRIGGKSRPEDGEEHFKENNT
ncbi:hypothetical protein PBY51_002695 [Eleginops maclovinus]|uniref:Uncharacterized protein n=1 Tax=Eleginops maclovinus TaxID=56733 RepID=A0AAN7XDF9_ELEMC|nr:hypothetical protein PBY51_002695 [Eleginops maclovinus]